jgi:hypothetical protein
MPDPAIACTEEGGGIVLSPYALDRLLYLQAVLDRQRAAAQMLYGPARATVDALFPRVVFSLYLDCIAAGAGEDARRILGRASGGERPAAPPAPLADDHDHDLTLTPTH